MASHKGRTLRIVTAAAAAAAMAAGLPALAQTAQQVVPGESIYVQPASAPHGIYHGGYINESDAVLLDQAIGAVESDNALNSAIVTMVANQGELTVNGTTTDLAQASRLEMKLKGLNGGTRVAAWFDSLGG